MQRKEVGVPGTHEEVRRTSVGGPGTPTSANFRSGTWYELPH